MLVKCLDTGRLHDVPIWRFEYPFSATGEIAVMENVKQMRTYDVVEGVTDSDGNRVAVPRNHE